MGQWQSALTLQSQLLSAPLSAAAITPRLDWSHSATHSATEEKMWHAGDHGRYGRVKEAEHNVDQEGKPIKTQTRDKQRSTRTNEGRRLTAEPQDVTVHLISVALKQLGCHFHHLLQGLHLQTKPRHLQLESLSLLYVTCVCIRVCVTRLEEMHFSPNHCRRPGLALSPGVYKKNQTIFNIIYVGWMLPILLRNTSTYIDIQICKHLSI